MRLADPPESSRYRCRMCEVKVTLGVGYVDGWRETAQSVVYKTKECHHFSKSSWESAGILVKINGQQIWRGEEISR